MSYGSPGVYTPSFTCHLHLTSVPEWQPWVLGEEEGIKHIKAAYDAGINTYDTANVRMHSWLLSKTHCNDNALQVYSNGLSEVVLGKAIKQHNLPRDEIVVMTKVSARQRCPALRCLTSRLQLYAEVKRNINESFTPHIDPDTVGYVNQHGLSRKVGWLSARSRTNADVIRAAHLRLGEAQLGASAARLHRSAAV